MQIFLQILRVIFLLSTIVIVTDCCSSRILLLREHTYKIVHEHNFHSHIHEHAHFGNIPKKIVTDLINQIIPGKSALQNQLEIESTTTTTINTEFDDTGQEFGASTRPNLNEHPDNEGTPLDNAAIPTNEQDQINTKMKAEAFDQYSVLQCYGEHVTNFCLNGGRCFRVLLGNNNIIYSCECSDDYVGERCEGKSQNGDYVVTPASELKQKPKLRVARIVFSFPMLLTLSVVYLIIGAMFVFRCPPQQKHRAAGMLAS